MKKLFISILLTFIIACVILITILDIPKQYAATSACEQAGGSCRQRNCGINQTENFQNDPSCSTYGSAYICCDNASTPTPGFIIPNFPTQFPSFYNYVEKLFGGDLSVLHITIYAQPGYEYEKMWTTQLLSKIDSEAPKFIDFLSKANLTIYFGVDENGKPITVSATSAHKMYMHNFDQSNELGFDTILTHELTHVVDFNNNPADDGRADLMKAVIADAGGNASNYQAGLLTHYSRELCLYPAARRTLETQLGEDYAESFAYYLIDNIESTACGSNGKNPYADGAHPNHKSLIEHVLYGKPLSF